MKQLYFISLIFFAISTPFFAQSDKSAEIVLDKFSAKALAAPSISIDFNLEIVDEMEGYTDNLIGSIVMKGDSYYLTTPDNIIWYNGTTSWSYYSDIDEVTISTLTEDESFLSRPSLFFTAYKDGYSCSLLAETATSYTISLSPKSKDNYMLIEQIKLEIDKKDSSLRSLEYKRTDGYTMFFSIDSYILTKKVSRDDFTFNAENYRSAEIIDLR